MTKTFPTSSDARQQEQPALPLSPAKSASQFLREADRIMTERGKTYDQPSGERAMLRTVTAFNAITGSSMTEAQGWLFMQVLKDVRQWQNPAYHADSAEDGVAYSALKAECLSQGGPK